MGFANSKKPGDSLKEHTPKKDVLDSLSNVAGFSKWGKKNHLQQNQDCCDTPQELLAPPWRLLFRPAQSKSPRDMKKWRN